MDILQEDNGLKGKFYVLENGVQEAQMTYTWAGDTRFIIDSTAVSEVLKGQNAGKQMLLNAVAFAREKGLKIIPLCPFAKAMFQKMPEIGDVL